MADEPERKTRFVTAPSATEGTVAGEVLTVEVGEDEDVEWIWSHDPDRGSSVTGYRIVPRSSD